MDEQPRPFANGDEPTYTLTIDEVVLRYEAAGHPRTPRAIQKYCARGDLDCVKEETAYGQRYRITPESVARHLAQIEEVHRTNVRGLSRTDASVRSLELPLDQPKNDQTNVREQPRPDAHIHISEHVSTGEQGSERSQPDAADDASYVSQLETRLSERDGEIVFLRTEIAVKNDQIKDLTERARETNHLIAGLQKMLSPLLGRGPNAGDNSNVGA